jgi:CRISPR-associated protein Cas1
MAAEMECAIYSAGLDPSLGFFHETEDRRPSLALDLIEPFRAPLADAMALDLISHRILSEDQHFERIEDGVYLNAAGRKRFFVSYERRMNREFVSEQTGQRTSLREEFRNQALGLRRHLQDEGQFKAFLMN